MEWASAIDKETQQYKFLVLRDTLRTRIGHRESWWISDEVQDKVKAKQTQFRELISMRGDDEANKSAAEERLDSKEGEKDIYRIAKARDRSKRDLGNVRFIKYGDGRTIVNEDAVRRRWKEYFFDLFNRKRSGQTEEVDSIGTNPQYNYYCSRIKHTKVKEALQKMGRNKAVGPDKIPIEAWRCSRIGDSARLYPSTRTRGTLNHVATTGALNFLATLERITKKRTKNEAKSTKLDMEWKRL
ncbi:hypothetical protein Tco_0610769 [Tanacetum coccineum]